MTDTRSVFNGTITYKVQHIPASCNTTYGILPVVSAPPYVEPERPNCLYCGKKCWSLRGRNQHVKRNPKCLAAERAVKPATSEPGG